MSNVIMTRGKERQYNYAPKESMTFMLSSAETSGQFDLAENDLGYCSGPPLHIHPEQDEVHYVLQGKLTYQVGEDRLELTTGDCLYIPKGTPHAWINLQQEPARILAFLMPGGSEGFFRTMASASSSVSATTLAKLGQAYGTEIIGPPLASDRGV